VCLASVPDWRRLHCGDSRSRSPCQKSSAPRVIRPTPKGGTPLSTVAAGAGVGHLSRTSLAGLPVRGMADI
jgi:hypothetical protein